MKPKWICRQPADYHPGLSRQAGTAKMKTGQPRTTPRDKFAYWFPSLPVSLWLHLRLAGIKGLLGVDIFAKREKPHIFHKFVFRMNLTVESSSTVEYASQRGNKTFFNKLSPPGEKLRWALCQYIYDKENICELIGIIFCLCKSLPKKKKKNGGCLLHEMLMKNSEEGLLLPGWNPKDNCPPSLPFLLFFTNVQSGSYWFLRKH